MKFRREVYSFDDVLLVPMYSEVTPDMVSLETYLTKNIKLKIPIVSAAMDTVTEHKMAIAIAKLGGAGVIHKNMTIQEQASEVSKVKKENLVCCAGVGATKDVLDRVDSLVKVGADAIFVDSAHGHSKNVIDAVKKIKEKIKKDNLKLDVVAGNVATKNGVLALIEAGVDAVKVGIGPGSICTTRIVAGVGVPQITAISDAAEAAESLGIPIIADGGIKYSGDIVKAIGAGAYIVMLGSLLAGHEESPGELLSLEGKRFKAYNGMGSLLAMSKGSGDRYSQEGSKKFVPEGVEGYTPFKGEVSETVYQLLGGLKSGLGYFGAENIEFLRKHGEFVVITSSGLKESHVHGIIAKDAPNYKG